MNQFLHPFHHRPNEQLATVVAVGGDALGGQFYSELHSELRAATNPLMKLAGLHFALPVCASSPPEAESLLVLLVLLRLKREFAYIAKRQRDKENPFSLFFLF